ncbi:predicted protein [Plenodomus lingam JN3]|uniref:Predicted protein n=1 Tax=Leptosphaeria maculans (strain JN3 / isolate v23.1.3 / race Av1-4-5-6-7-8) TaxID=985895 RepID=E5A0E1_LEPMJ|nr:predicted protein [Plenodomus lingam JN3]CBX97001.1 predicted protein [Plenodomus lingam JN3]
MPDAQAAAPAEEGKGPIRTIVQSVGIFLLIQGAMKYILPQASKAPVTPVPSQDGTSVAPPSANGQPVAIPAWENRPRSYDAGVQHSIIPYNVAPMWPVGTEVDFSMYISSSIAMPPLDSMPTESLLIEEKNFKFGDYSQNREINTEFKVPKDR